MTQRIAFHEAKQAQGGRDVQIGPVPGDPIANRHPQGGDLARSPPNAIPAGLRLDLHAQLGQRLRQGRLKPLEILAEREIVPAKW